MTTFHAVARRPELPPGRMMPIAVEGREIALANVAGRYFAFGNKCTCLAQFSPRIGVVRGNDFRSDTKAGRLAEGALMGQRVACPLHGTTYDLATGHVVTGPAEIAVNTYEVIADGEELRVAEMSDVERHFWQDPGAATSP